MSEIILDFGSGNTCKNDLQYIKKMYDELKKVDNGKHRIIVKWQLFKDDGINTPLNPNSFNYAYNYGRQLGYEVTSSVNDIESMKYLTQFDIPFVKISNNHARYFLIDLIPPKLKVYVSGIFMNPRPNMVVFNCISKYPASVEDYENKFDYFENISDHTDNFELYKKYKPKRIEWHYRLLDSTGLDSGSFARTPEQLQEVIFSENNID
jgi:sialic acid synthase SpsE